MKATLTQFVDFVLKSGSPKFSAVKKVYKDNHEEYSPSKDYYKRFREAVVELHEKDLSVSRLSEVIGDLPSSKREHYDAMITGYKKFIGRKKFQWLAPAHKDWKHGELTISVRPELGLVDEKGNYILIKLYTKADKLSKDKAKGLLCLFYNQLGKKGKNSVGILDVRNAKLFVYDENMSELMPLMEGEALSFISMYNSLESDI